MRANITYIHQSHTGALETLNDFRLGRIRNGRFSDESEGRVTGLSAGSDDKLSDVASAADDENLALFGHCELFRRISREKCGIERTKRKVTGKLVGTNGQRQCSYRTELEDIRTM